MTHLELNELKRLAKSIRKEILISINKAGSGHTGGSLGLADIFTFLYFVFLKHDPQNPKMPDRDKLILSAGHVAPVLYATLAHNGYFPIENLHSLRKLGSPLQGHPSLSSGIPGLETSSGSLGQGLSIAIGMALADKIDNVNRKIVCICGDGELQEGQIWEAAMSASHHKLNSLICIVDRNNVQIDGNTKDVMSIEPLKSKWESFGWEVSNCNGNDFESISSCFNNLKYESPNLIIAKTKMGTGIPKIENDYTWHGKAPDNNELKTFLEQLY